jgi:type VI secretion system protein ImpI
MSLRLVIEHSPWQQPVTELAHPGGELSIGRGTEADWRLEDPDQFISRRHCVIQGGAEGFTVTDTSRGGVFLDGSEEPLGPGRSRALSDGTRIRLGDVVIRAELVEAAGAAAPAFAGAFAADDFFAQRPIAATPPPRPAGLPDPFDAPRARHPARFEAEERRAPPSFDDPFTLDPLPTPQSPEPETPRESRVAVRGAEPVPAPPEPPSRPGDASLAAALLRGLGLPEEGAASLGAVEMEALGRRHRALIEGLALSLRSRARERQNLRVAQTVLGSSEVNPLKTLPSTDDLVAALVGPARPGYLDADAAIAAAQRDLADHQVRSWTGVQAALRRMIDRFDPEAIEGEAEEAGRLRAILAGGRASFLWRLYRERFRTIAKAAEERFLGEVGSDFRDAYESRGRQDHD